MIDNVYCKQPFEVETIKIDWHSRINTIGVSGYAISTVAIEIFDSKGQDKTTNMLEGSVLYSGTDILLTIKDGMDGEDYFARIRVTLTKAGYVTLYQEEDLVINVRQRGF